MIISYLSKVHSCLYTLSHCIRQNWGKLSRRFVFFKKRCTITSTQNLKKLVRVDFSEKFKLGQSWQNRPKMLFLAVSEKFIISFSWKKSKMKNHIVIDISPRNPYLVKSWFKVQNVFDQYDCRILQSEIFEERSWESNWFFAYW